MKLYRLCLLLRVCHCLSFDYDLSIQLPKVLWNETIQDKLKKDLFMNYDKRARPHGPETTTVHMALVILHVESNERKSTITLHTLLKVVWNDPKLKWNKEIYGDIDVLRVADHEVWHPDLFLTNSGVGGEPVFRYGNPNALVHSNGEVRIVLRAKQTVFCQLDLSYWPFDTHHCFLKYSSWVHSADLMKLGLLDAQTTAEVDTTFPFSSWNITSTSAEVTIAKRQCCAEPFYLINYNLTLVRNHNTYVAVLVTPALVSALLVLTQFWLPPGSKSKYYLNGFLLVIFISHLVHFVDKISRITYHMPLIVLFYAYNLYITCTALLIETVGIYLTRSKKFYFLEIMVEKNLARRFPTIFFAKQNILYDDNKVNANERLLSDGIEGVAQHNQECYFLATVFNRVMFLFYAIVLCIACFTLK